MVKRNFSVFLLVIAMNFAMEFCTDWLVISLPFGIWGMLIISILQAIPYWLYAQAYRKNCKGIGKLVLLFVLALLVIVFIVDLIITNGFVSQIVHLILRVECQLISFWFAKSRF